MSIVVMTGLVAATGARVWAAPRTTTPGYRVVNIPDGGLALGGKVIHRSAVMAKIAMPKAWTVISVTNTTATAVLSRDRARLGRVCPRLHGMLAPDNTRLRDTGTVFVADGKECIGFRVDLEPSVYFAPSAAEVRQTEQQQFSALEVTDTTVAGRDGVVLSGVLKSAPRFHITDYQVEHPQEGLVHLIFFTFDDGRTNSTVEKMIASAHLVQPR